MISDRLRCATLLQDRVDHQTPMTNDSRDTRHFKVSTFSPAVSHGRSSEDPLLCFGLVSRLLCHAAHQILRNALKQICRKRQPFQ